MQSRQNQFADSIFDIKFHSQLDAWNDLLQALVFCLQAEILPAPLIVAMPPMLGLDAAAAALDAEGAEHFAAADAALLTRLFSMLFLLEWGEILHVLLRLQWKRPWNAALASHQRRTKMKAHDDGEGREMDRRNTINRASRVETLQHGLLLHFLERREVATRLVRLAELRYQQTLRRL